MSDSKPSVVYILPKINSRIMEYAQAATGEISGFGSINPHNGIVDKLFPLMNQTCSGAETEINPEMILEFIKSGQSARANVWWHSHVNMGCFWSPTDNECIETLGQTMTSLLSIVVNKKREYKARFDLFRPIRVTLDVVMCFYYEFPFDEIERIRAEVKDKVKPKIYVVKETKAERRTKSVIRHGMSELELGLYGFKVVGNTIINMTQDEFKAFKDKHLKLTVENCNDLIESVGGSEDLFSDTQPGAVDSPPFNWREGD